jgi:hypothetical protein
MNKNTTFNNINKKTNKYNKKYKKYINYTKYTKNKRLKKNSRKNRKYSKKYKKLYGGSGLFAPPKPLYTSFEAPATTSFGAPATTSFEAPATTSFEAPATTSFEDPANLVCKPASLFHTIISKFPVGMVSYLYPDHTTENITPVELDTVMFRRAQLNKYFVIMHGGPIVRPMPIFKIPANIILVHPVRSGNYGVIGNTSDFITTFGQKNFLKFIGDAELIYGKLDENCKIYMPGDKYYDISLSFDKAVGNSNKCCIRYMGDTTLPVDAEETVSALMSDFKIDVEHSLINDMEITLNILLKALSQTLETPERLIGGVRSNPNIMVFLNACNGSSGYNQTEIKLRDRIDINGKNRAKEIYTELYKNSVQTRQSYQITKPLDDFGFEGRCDNVFNHLINGRELLDGGFIKPYLSERLNGEECCKITRVYPYHNNSMIELKHSKGNITTHYINNKLLNEVLHLREQNFDEEWERVLE